MKHLRERSNELWHRKNIFMLISAALETGMPIANALKECVPLYEPLGSEIKAVYAGINNGKQLCEIASQDFNGAPPKWLRFACRYEKKGQSGEAFARLSRFADKSLPLRILLNLIFWRSEPKRLTTWLPLIFLGLLCLPVLPFTTTKNGIVVLGIYKGDSLDIYSIGELSDFLLIEKGGTNDHTSPTSSKPGNKTSPFRNLYTHFDKPWSLETLTKKKDFASAASSYGYSRDISDCMWTKEFYARVMQEDRELNQILDRVAPSPVPVVWMFRGFIVGILKAIGEPVWDQNMRKNIDDACGKSRLHQALDKSDVK